MMRFIFLFLLFALPSSAYAQKVSVQIDGSGSMAGFDKSAELDALVNVLERACERAGIPSETVFFVSIRSDTVAWHDAERFQKTKAWGGYTNLEAAFDTGYDRAPIVMMLTDNVQAASDLDARALYACFSRDTIEVLRAIPLKRMFEGVLSNPLPDAGRDALRRLNPDAEIRFRSDGRLYYKGMKGFVLYLFLTQARYRSQYEQLVAALQRADMEPMAMKPINDTITLKPGLIRPIVAALSDKTRLRFNFTLDSRLEHIDIEPSESENSAVQFKVQSPQVHARKVEDRILFGRRSSHSGRVSPPTLIDTLSSAAKHTSVYTCLVHFGPFRPGHRNFWEYLSLARIGPVPADYFFSVSIEIPPNSFRMTKAYKKRYFTDQPGVLNRIYTPTDLIQYLHQRPVTVIPLGGSIAGELQVRPLEGPWIAWIALCLLLVGLVVTLVWIAFYPIKYRLTDSLNQVQERTERLGLGPLSKRIDLKMSNAAGDEIGLGTIGRRAIFQFAFHPQEGVQVEDGLGNDLVEELRARERKEDGAPDPNGAEEEIELPLEIGKALTLRKGDMTVDIERVAARF